MYVYALAASLYLASSVATPITANLPISQSEQQDWAQYSPYFPAAKYKAPPNGCEITQVNILQRHGARFPTAGATTKIVSALKKIQSVTDYKDPRLDFITNFKYNLGHDDLVPFGADQSFDAGQEAYTRYAKLLHQSDLPFVRSDISTRVVDSANNWTAGFAAASGHTLKPVLSVILDSSKNDTLDDSQCPAAGSSDPQTGAWEAVYIPPVASHLNAAAPGANLTTTDVFNLISLCPFVSIFDQNKSAWCTLFEQFPTALSGFAYDGDLNKFYGTGYGQPLGPVQGVGYVNELLARLTGNPVQDSTQTNHTLDSSSTTFPLDRIMYADFSHDDEISAIVSAIGLFRQPQNLDPTSPDPNRTWRASFIVPFSSHIVFERLSCTTYSQGKKGTETKLRILAQDEVQHLDFCGADSDGLCALDAFVESQSFARNNGNGDFEKCFANTTAPS